MDGSDYERFKDEGNKKFKNKDYKGALESYTKALASNGDGLLAYSNRAMCHLNLGQYYEAKLDCDKSISLDSTFTKAYYRRATANRELYRLREAIDDLEKVIELDAQFEIARKELTKLKSDFVEDNRITMKVTAKPVSLQSTKPVKTFQTLNQYTGTRQY